MSEPGEHKNEVRLLLHLGCGGVGQGRTRKMCKSIITQVEEERAAESLS